ncbi:MAG TPA: alkaline phytoceramidase [Casimicrobiaceae bacterium]|nr:alkaline phytoceramidase [Casimicrobiaceae bacterium]
MSHTDANAYANEMIPQTRTTARFGREARIAIIWATAAAIGLAAFLAPRFEQPEDYHRFADDRAMLGVPNLFDVASNLAFLIVGAMGLYFVLRGKRADGGPAFTDTAESWGWGVAFAAVALTSCGSAYYHWAPDSSSLAWDRLPMAVGFMSIVAAIVAERISAKAGLRLLIPLALLGAASVWYWRWSATRGVENLNPYGAVQFGSALIILLIIILFPPRYNRSQDLLGAAILYALAKVAEHFDRDIFIATGGLVSGHTLKHLLAALAVLWILRMLRLRQPIGAERP